MASEIVKYLIEKIAKSGPYNKDAIIIKQTRGTTWYTDTEVRRALHDNIYDEFSRPSDVLAGELVEKQNWYYLRRLYTIVKSAVKRENPDMLLHYLDEREYFENFDLLFEYCVDTATNLGLYSPYEREYVSIVEQPSGVVSGQRKLPEDSKEMVKRIEKIRDRDIEGY